MPVRGFSIEVPAWWLDDLDTVMRQRKLSHTELAKMLIPARPPLHGDHLKRAIAAARVKVTRFFDEDPAKRVRTIEIIRAWTAALGLLPFEFRADTREEARALAFAKAEPTQVQRAAAAAHVAAMLESGETRLEDLLSGRQPGDVASPDGNGAPVRRGSRPAGNRPPHPPRLRG
jgi:hypothetical protein